MALSRKPSLGARPSGPSCMHIVPPVPMMRTRDSGRPALTGGGSVDTAAGDMSMNFCYYAMIRRSVKKELGRRKNL